ncbi:MAG: hypothetical protein EXR65_01735 [Dehalococcoidia bacterium]|nr:hypothetical protein [Dehalococcoidia bacterium]
MGVWIGRYCIVAGEVREHGPWIVERQRVRDDESVRLLVLAEPVDQRSSEFCAEVAGAVAELFGRESLSLTGGLLRALQQAHANLAEWNRRSLREHQVAVGISCVAIRDGEATLAMAGPGVAHVNGPEGVRRLSTDGQPAAMPLGGPQPLQPLFQSFRLADHQLLLLSSQAERAAGAEAVTRAFAAGPRRALAQLYVRTRAQRDMAAVLVAEIEGVDGDTPAFALSAPEPPPAEPARSARVDSGAAAEPPVGGGARPPLPVLRRQRVAGRPGEGARLPWRAIVLALAAVIAIAALARFVLPPLLAQDRDAKLGTAIASAERHLATAEAGGEAGERRAQLQAAQAEIAGARSIDEQEPRVQQLDQRAQTVLRQLDAVVDLHGLRKVIEFDGTLTAPARPAALRLGGGALWLLESDRGRVFTLDLARPDAPPVEVYRGGSSYGGTAARAPLQIAWDAAEQRLLLLDAERALFAIQRGATPKPLPLRGAADLRSLQALAVYRGNLYLLDPQGGEVWRYLPAGAGFDSERSDLLGRAEIHTAQALFVDAELFLLEPAALRHFREGRELPPLLRGVDRAPDGAAGLVSDQARGRLYSADRGGRRILATDRNGAFIAQYRHPQFFDLRDLALSDDGTELYVLTGSGIYAFPPLTGAGRP